MSNQLSSKIALAYTGTNATRPPNMFIFSRAPTSTDYQNFSLGDYWLYRVNPMQNNGKLYVLLGLVANVANWALITSSSGIVEFLEGNSGGAVGPNASEIINVVGDGTTVNVVGNPGTNTLTISTEGIVSNSFPTDSGTATPSSGVLNIKADVSTLNCGSSVEFTGSSNTVLLNVTDANNNTIIGKGSGLAGITGTDNTILGEGNATGLTSGSSNIFIGTGNGTNLTTEGSNTIIGNNIDGVVSSGGYVAIGQSSSELFINNFPGNGGGNVFIGYHSGESALNINNSDNTSVGQSSCQDLTSGASNACHGYQAGASLTTGSTNTLIGRDAGLSVTTGASNLCLGNGSGNSLATSDSNNTLINHAGISGGSNFTIMAIPSGVTTFICDGIDELYVGLNSGNVNTMAVNNTVFGNGSLPLVTTASGNQLFGNAIMTTVTTTGSNNCVVGGSAFNIGTGSNNLIVGSDAFAKATTATGNTVLGLGAGFDSVGGVGLTTGNHNILIGYGAGNTYTSSESGNIIIGGDGVNGDNYTLRIGYEGNGGASSLTAAFVDGIYGVTTTSGTTATVLVSDGGQLGTVSSSERFKKDIQDMADQSSAIMDLRPVTFQFKKHTDNIKQYGLIAEEVDKVMPEIVNYDDGKPFAVRYHDLVPMLLNEIQKLSKRIEQLESK